MTAKGIVVILSVVAVLGALAVMFTLSFTATPTTAQQPTPSTAVPAATPEPTPSSTNMPDSTSAEDTETLALMDQYCHDGQPYELYIDVVDDGQGKIVSLSWQAHVNYWDLPEGLEANYRIERRTHGRYSDGGEWQVVATITDADTWKGPADVGHWHYRVGLVSLQSGDLVRECQAKWAAQSIDILTTQEEFEQQCGSINIYDLTATIDPSPDGQGETVTLKWGTYHNYNQYDSPALPEGTVWLYHVERSRVALDGSKGDWQMVAEVSDTNTWTAVAEPGAWIYRVALAALQVGDMTHQCEKPLWEKTEVLWVLSAEERAREASDRRILIEQATMCAKDALTANFTPEAQEVLSRHIERRVAEVVADHDSEELLTYDLVTLAVLFCADGEIVSGYGFSLSAQTYILFVLFDEGYGW